MKEFVRKSTAEIVQLTPNDWNVLKHLKIRSVQEEPIAFGNYQKELEKYANRTESEWKNILAGGRSDGKEGETVTVFARLGRQYVGMVSSVLTHDFEMHGMNALVQHMYVAEAFRGRGVGKDLLSCLLEKLTDKGVRIVDLDVVETQKAARNLYNSLGFEVIRKFSSENHKGLQEIRMQKVIRQPQDRKR